MLVLALALGLDCLAVAVGIGISGPSRREGLRVALTFTLFDVVMPLAGLFVGRGLGTAIGSAAAVVAALALVALGLWTVRAATRSTTAHAPAGQRPAALASGVGLFTSALTVSVDALAVGFTLPFLGAPAAVAIAIIAATGFFLTVLGLAFGQRLGARVGERAELVSGVFLAFAGLFILAEALRV